MKIVHDPVKTLRSEIGTWDTPFVCFGTDSAERIVQTMYDFAEFILAAVSAAICSTAPASGASTAFTILNFDWIV
jgi:hypothetical protein